MKEHDPVNHPSHYTSSNAKCSKCGHPIECIDVTETMNFNLGNTVKYVWRQALKNGMEDLRKAAWYLAREVERLEKRRLLDSLVVACDRKVSVLLKEPRKARKR